MIASSDDWTIAASCASKPLPARSADTQTTARRAWNAQALPDPVGLTLGCLASDAAPQVLQLLHDLNTAILSLRSVRRQWIAAVRPSCWSRRHADRGCPSLDANECALVARCRLYKHRPRYRPIPRTQNLRRFAPPN